MTPIRLALIGYGRWGRNYVKAAEESGEAVVVSTVSSRNEGAFFLSRIKECHADAVVYAGHPSLAAHVCEVVLRFPQLPILCEKPAGLSLADAERIAAAEAKSKAFVLVGHQHLFASEFNGGRYRPPHAESAFAFFTGPVARDYSPLWDYGPHAVSCLLALGVEPSSANWTVGVGPLKRATVVAEYDDWCFEYDGYATREPPLTRQVRAFARAVRNGGTDDYRFGAKWAVDVARVLTAASSQ